MFATNRFRPLTQVIRIGWVVFFLGLCAWTSQCTQRLCPSYETAFITNDTLRWTLFSPFSYAGVGSPQIPPLPWNKPVHLPEGADTISLLNEAVGRLSLTKDPLPKKGLKPRPPHFPVTKNQALLIYPLSNKKKLKRMKWLKIKEVRPKGHKKNKWTRGWETCIRWCQNLLNQILPPKKTRTYKSPTQKISLDSKIDSPDADNLDVDSLDMDNIGIEHLEKDSLDNVPVPPTEMDSLFASPMDTTTQLSARSFLEDGEVNTALEKPVENPYKYPYRSDDHFNVEQIFYNQVLGSYLFKTDMNPKTIEEDEGKSTKEDSLEVPISYEEYLKETQEEDQEDNEEPENQSTSEEDTPEDPIQEDINIEKEDEGF
ncbi:MAG: hypothetical protein OXB93_01085 [Cytophagales bacterium]|nr:hypothetical protein [Cytophagales bacterium]